MATSCNVGHRRDSDPVLLWLWLAAAAPICTLFWDPLYAAGVAQKSSDPSAST